VVIDDENQKLEEDMDSASKPSSQTNGISTHSKKPKHMQFSQQTKQKFEGTPQKRGVNSFSKPHSNFEGCRTLSTPVVLMEASEKEAGVIDQQAATTKGTITCGHAFITLEEETLQGVTHSCCPIASELCAGCAKFVGSGCAKPTGGYTNDDGEVNTICSDIANWVDSAGKTCHELITKSDKKNKGLSSKEACCRHGGGQRAATPFVYPVVNLVLAENQVLGQSFPYYAMAGNTLCPIAHQLASGRSECQSALQALGLALGSAKDGKFYETERPNWPGGCSWQVRGKGMLRGVWNRNALGTAYKSTFQPICKLDDAVSKAETLASPLPRTASTYSLNHGCDLGKHGLQIDGVTGALKLHPKCCVGGHCKIGCGSDEDFQISCTVTAHQSPDRNAKAKLIIVGTKFGYADTPMVLREGKVSASPIQKWPLTAAEMVCIPSTYSEWLSIDENTGTLSAQLISSFKGGITGDNNALGSNGANCFISANNSITKERHTTSVMVFAPQIWESISYGTVPSTIVATVGEERMAMHVQIPDKTQVAPHQYSMFCSVNQPSTGVKFVFDTLTGVGMINGHPALTLDLDTGSLLVSPRKSLGHLFDELDRKDGEERRTLKIKCVTIGYYQELPQLPRRSINSPIMDIQIRDDTCWVTRNSANFVGRKRQELESGTSCRKACRLSVSCTDFETDVSDATQCWFMTGVCITGASCPLTNRDVTTRFRGCGEQRSCIQVKIQNRDWQSGPYCPVGHDADGGMIYTKDANTIPDTLFLAKWNADRDAMEGSQAVVCDASQYVIKHSAPGVDYDDPESNYIELKGAAVNCIGGTSVSDDFLTKVFELGSKSYGNGAGEIGAKPCGRPNMTVDSSDEEGEEEQTVQTLVLDDPATLALADYWMHPCDCFPELWGSSPPVHEESMLSVPPGSHNRYTPAAVQLVLGSFTCQEKFLLRGKVLFLDMIESSEPQTCEAHCVSDDLCHFFWEGEVAAGKQCRLFSTCENIVRENGLNGNLAAVPRNGHMYCHIADPDGCWGVTGRRAFLGADMPSSSQWATCAWLKIVQQCDHKLLIGGMGIELCGRCSHKRLGNSLQLQWEQKKNLPMEFVHGQTIDISCCAERFGPSPTTSSTVKKDETLTCMAGEWKDRTGWPGLSNFACAACLQVVKPDYVTLDLRNKQELYFVSRMMHQFWIRGEQESGLSRIGILQENVADSFFLKPVQESMSIESVDLPGTCLESKNFVYQGQDQTSGGHIELPLLGSATCDATKSRQRFTAGELPEFLLNKYIVTYMSHLDKMSSYVLPSHFNQLVLLMDCGNLAVGEMQWSILGTKIALKAACRPSTGVGEHTPSVQPMPASDTSVSASISIARQLAGCSIKCGIGEAATKLEKTTTHFNYACATISGMGGCHAFNTQQSDITSTSSVGLAFLTNSAVVCAKDEVMQSIIAERNGNNWFRYRYTCCFSAGLPITILPSGNLLKSQFQRWEGIYCPTSRDPSGRLTFGLVQQFGAKVLQFGNSIFFQILLKTAKRVIWECVVLQRKALVSVLRTDLAMDFLGHGRLHCQPLTTGQMVLAAFATATK